MSQEFDHRWSLVDGKAIYNGYYFFDIEEFKKTYESLDFNCNNVKKYWHKRGRKIPAEIFYSLRRVLNLPKFNNWNGSCYDLPK